jgi:hypothetical protein
MGKSNDSSNLGHAKLEKRPLADSELDAVSGGRGVDVRKGGAIIVYDYEPPSPPPLPAPRL